MEAIVVGVDCSYWVQMIVRDGTIRLCSGSACPVISIYKRLWEVQL